MSRNRRYCWLTLALASSAGALEQPYQAISQTKLQKWQGEGFFTLNKDWFSNHDGSGFDAHGQSLAAQLTEFSYSYLLFASQEMPLPRVRYRLRLWRYPAQSIQSPALSRIELSRFNLGPMQHKQLVLELGEAHVAPLQEFGEGNDPVWHALARQTQLGDDSLSESWRELWVWPGGEVALFGYDLCHPDRQSDCQPKAD